MEFIRGLENAPILNEGSYATLGIFDGVHLGHQKILKMLKKMSGPGEDTVLLTFDPHPVRHFNPRGRFYEISSVEERAKLVESYGIDYFIVAEFGKSIAHMKPEEFAEEVLIGRLHVKGIVVGYDFVFGKDREGGIPLLKHLGKLKGFRVLVADPVVFMGSIVSSTRIRELILSGRVREASFFLGRAFNVSGKVIHGAGRGRNLGFPTANVEFHQDLLPLTGVYAVRVMMKGERMNGVANVGFNPTFGEKSLRVEVFIFDFDGDVYGERISLYFIDRIRDERKYPSPEELVAQMKRDVWEAKRRLGEYDKEGK